jgi:hypothetical protein
MYQEVVVGVEGVGDGSGSNEAVEPARGKELMAQEPSFIYEAMLTFYDAIMGGNFKTKTSKKRRGTG